MRPVGQTDAPRVAHARPPAAIKSTPAGPLPNDLQQVRNVSVAPASRARLVSCVASDDGAGALRAVRVMRTRRVPPGLQGYAMAMNVNARFGDAKAVEALAAEATLDGLPLDARLCNPRIQALAAMRDLAGARAVFHSMPEAARDVGTYDALVTAHLRAGDVQGALGVVRGMLQPDARIKPDDAIFTAMVRALGEAAQPDDALALFREMPNVGVAHDWCSAAAAMHALAKVGDAAGTIALLRQMQAQGIGVETTNYNIAIRACEHEPSLVQALALLDEMRETDAPHLQPTVASFNAALHVCARAARPDTALVLHRDMLDRGLRPDRQTDAALIAAHAASGEVDRAIELLDSTFPQPDVDLVTKVLRGFTDAHAAERWFQTVRHRTSPGGYRGQRTTSTTHEVARQTTRGRSVTSMVVPSRIPRAQAAVPSARYRPVPHDVRQHRVGAAPAGDAQPTTRSDRL